MLACFSFIPVHCQEAATDALLSMTSVLKDESSAGESYEVLFDGARSLVTGLGSMLRVSSFGAQVYGSESPVTHVKGSPQYRRRREIENRRSLLSGVLAKRHERDTDNGLSDAQEQVILETFDFRELRYK